MLSDADSGMIHTMAQQRGRRPGLTGGGRKSHGPRKATTVRLPHELYRTVAAAAERDGVTVDAYLVRITAEAHGHDIPPYCQPRRQEALAIAG